MIMFRGAITLAAGGLLPGTDPKPIPGLNGPVTQLLGYGLWLVVLAGATGVIIGVTKLALADKSRHGGGAEPLKWMGAGAVAVILSGSLIAIINGIAGG
ncbi:hypothetical protein [Streptomyces griseosporeus]